MLIEIEGEQYRCHWKGVGFSYACPVIQKRGMWLGIPCWRTWSSEDVVKIGADETIYLRGEVGRMKPKEMRAAFETAIRKQIEYNAAWSAAC